MGVVLEPEAAYELNPHTGGGVEDPRVSYVAALGVYVMTYTAYGPGGPRIAMAVSRDLVRWQRTGLVRFAPLAGIDLAQIDNKDALLFPEPVRVPDGDLALALIHRPAFQAPLPGLCEPRPSMWISYARLDESLAGQEVVFGHHHLLATPQQEWEGLKIGGGAPRSGALRGGWSCTTASRAGSSRGWISSRECAYYGMADSRIGVARACLADLLTPAHVGAA